MISSALPDRWRWVELGEACTPDRNGIQPDSKSSTSLPYLSLEHVESETGRILLEETNGNTEDIRSMTYAFDERHVLYGKLRPYLNKVALPEFKGRCTTELIPLLPRNTERRFLAWLLRRPETVDEAMRGKTGSRMPRTDMSNLMKMVIALPPLEEQKRIAAIIDEQMQAVEEARRAAEQELEAAESLAAAYLREVFESEEAQTWKVRTIGQIATVQGGIQKQPHRKPRKFHRPYLTVRNVQRGYFDLSQVEEFEITANELKTYRLKYGDILIVEGNGSLNHIGRNAIFRDEIQDCIHQNHIIRVRLDESVADPEFVSRYLNSDVGKAQMVEKARTSSGLYTLSAARVQSLEVALPSPTEQRRIVETTNERLEAVDELHTSLNEQIEAMNVMPAAILHRAFNGEY